MTSTQTRLHLSFPFTKAMKANKGQNMMNFNALYYKKSLIEFVISSFLELSDFITYTLTIFQPGIDFC